MMVECSTVCTQATESCAEELATFLDTVMYRLKLDDASCEYVFGCASSHATAEVVMHIPSHFPISFKLSYP